MREVLVSSLTTIINQCIRFVKLQISTAAGLNLLPTGYLTFEPALHVFLVTGGHCKKLH